MQNSSKFCSPAIDVGNEHIEPVGDLLAAKPSLYALATSATLAECMAPIA